MNRNLPPGMAMETPAAEATEDTAANVDTVPLDALGMPDENDQMTPPEVGDEVSYQVTGKVTAINGSNADIERTAINGKEVGNTEGQEPANESEAVRNEASGLTSLD